VGGGILGEGSGECCIVSSPRRVLGGAPENLHFRAYDRSDNAFYCRLLYNSKISELHWASGDHQVKSGELCVTDFKPTAMANGPAGCWSLRFVQTTAELVDDYLHCVSDATH